MVDAPSPIEARYLLSAYQQVSRGRRYENDDVLGELARLADALSNKLPLHQRAVTAALRDFFLLIQEDFGELNDGRISWEVLDAVILEAVHYVARGGDEKDGSRIAAAVTKARRDWCGR